MNRDELYKLLLQKEKQFDTAKWRRFLLTIAAFAVLFFLLACISKKPTGIDILYSLLGSVVGSFFYVLINTAVFGNLARIGESENRMIENIKKQIKDLDNAQ